MRYDDILTRVTKLHFIGIGGSGMCPMAEILLQKGYQITGSDLNESDTLDRIRSYGIQVTMGHFAENIGDAQAVVYTAAVNKENPELQEALKRGIPTYERSVMLGIVAHWYKNSIGISGTHGKTTATSMLTQVCIEGGGDPSAIIGGHFPFIGSNSCIGASDTLICEACEYVDSFLQLSPTISVILNIDADHLDYFGSLENIIHSFHQFARQTSRAVFLNGDDENTKKAVQGITNAACITFGLGEGNDYQAVNIREVTHAYASFTVLKAGKPLCDIALSVPGKHNVYNALAAAAVADHLGISASKIAEGLHHFTGAHRRFERLGTYNNIAVFDDFAHHPAELTVTLTAAMEMGAREVWAIFQPHTFSRTYLFLDDFAKALAIPNHTILSEILPVREKNIYNIYAKDLAEKISGCVWFPTFEEIAAYVTKKAQPGDLIITLGGGDVYKCANLIVQKYQQAED